MDQFEEYVVPFNDRFICKFCGCLYFEDVPMIKLHLSGRDSQRKCNKVPQDVQAKAISAIVGGGGGGGRSNKKARIDRETPTPPPPTSEEHNIASMLAQGLQQSSTVPGAATLSNTNNTDHHKDRDEVDKKLVKFLVSNNIDFKVVETPSFKDFLTSAIEYGTSYEIPSYSTLRTMLIPDSGKEVEEYVAMVKKSWAITGCTLASDMWISDDRTYVSIVAYSPRGAVFLNSFEVSKEQQKTGTYLKDIMASVVDDIGAEHVVQIITNNAKSSSAGEGDDMLMGRYPHLYNTSCFSRGIHLLLKDIYVKIEWVRKVIDDAKLIVTFMCNDKKVLSLMREHTNIRKLVRYGYAYSHDLRPCATRFISNIKMVESVINVESELRMLVASSHWKGLLEEEEEEDYTSVEAMAAKGLATFIIENRNFWKRGKEVLQALNPIVRVLQLVDGECSSTYGYIYEAMERAKEQLMQRAEEACQQHQDNNNYDDDVASNYWSVRSLFCSMRFNIRIIHPVHAAAALLNPLNMWNPNFKENSSEMKAAIKYLLDNLVALDDKPTFLDELESYKMMTISLFTTTAVKMLKTLHPRVWWERCGGCLPTLRKYAVRILSQPCSSRNWSTNIAREVAQIRRRNGQLPPQMLKTLVYVVMNKMMMDKFKVIKGRDLEPIDVDNLDEPPDNFDINEQQNKYRCSRSELVELQIVEGWIFSWLDECL